MTTGNQRQQMSDGSDEEDRPKRQKKGKRKPPAVKIEDTGCSSDNFVEFLEGSEVSDDKYFRSEEQIQSQLHPKREGLRPRVIHPKKPQVTMHSACLLAQGALTVQQIPGMPANLRLQAQLPS